LESVYTFTEVITKLKLRYHFLDHSVDIFHSFLPAVDRWRHQWCPTTTRQVIDRRPDSYQYSETGRWSGCTIYRRTVIS